MKHPKQHFKDHNKLIFNSKITLKFSKISKLNQAQQKFSSSYLLFFFSGDMNGKDCFNGARLVNRNLLTLRSVFLVVKI
jgi:hypothetical protein